MLFLFIVIGSIAAGAEWTAFINIPSIGFVVLAAVGLALMKYKAGAGKAEFTKGLPGRSYTNWMEPV